jgi:hypothetical protein
MALMWTERMLLYREQFPKGSRVRIVDRRRLTDFQRTWKFHDPVSDDMLAFAGRTSIVVGVGFYHGGDVLYQLADVPGVWHEVCVEADQP